MPRRGGNSQKDNKSNRRKPQGQRETTQKVKTNPQPQQPIKPTLTQSRTAYLSANLTGQTVDVQVKDGSWYQGIYTLPPANKGFGAILQFCRLIETRNEDGTVQFAKEVIPRKIIIPDEIVQLLAKDITFVGDMANGGSHQRDSFKTDSAISRSGDIKERNLERWQPDENVPKPVWSPQTSNHTWDQFSTNEKLFGVKTSFNEDMYTTKLDKNSEFYKKNEMRAAKLASEISKESSSNVHIASDRGIDMEMDEEALYGAVIRDDVKTPNPYVPPAKQQKAWEPKPAAAAAPAQATSAPPKETKAPAPVIFTPTIRKPVVISSPGGSASSGLNSSIDVKKHINALLCGAMDARLHVDPSKVDPHWKSTTGSYKSEEVPTAYQAYPAYNPYPSAPMGYAPYPQMGFYPPMGAPAPGYPGSPYQMMMGYPPH